MVTKKKLRRRLGDAHSAKNYWQDEAFLARRQFKQSEANYGAERSRANRLDTECRRLEGRLAHYGETIARIPRTERAIP